VDASFGGLSRRDALAYIPAQITGCILGAIIANVMFAVAAISISTKHRATPAHLSSEVIATLGLLLVIFSLARTKRGNMAPAAVGAYIGAAYWFTSSTSFANPAISIGRMFSNTFAGIAPAFSSWVRRRGAGRRRGRDRRAESALSGHHARRGRGGGHATRRGSRARRHTARTRSRKHRGIEEGRAASRCDPGPPARPASAHWRDDALVIGTGACRPALSLAVDLLCHSGDDRRAGHLHRDARCESEIAALSN
jgi:Major intrinsic protein